MPAVPGVPNAVPAAPGVPNAVPVAGLAPNAVEKAPPAAGVPAAPGVAPNAVVPKALGVPPAVGVPAPATDGDAPNAVVPKAVPAGLAPKAVVPKPVPAGEPTAPAVPKPRPASFESSVCHTHTLHTWTQAPPSSLSRRLIATALDGRMGAEVRARARERDKKRRRLVGSSTLCGFRSCADLFFAPLVASSLPLFAPSPTTRHHLLLSRALSRLVNSCVTLTHYSTLTLTLRHLYRLSILSVYRCLIIHNRWLFPTRLRASYSTVRVVALRVCVSCDLVSSRVGPSLRLAPRHHRHACISDRHCFASCYCSLLGFMRRLRLGVACA